jgi:hypothetical protein
MGPSIQIRDDQNSIADRCNELAIAANSILEQLPKQGDRQYRYFFGILVRYRTILSDIAVLLRKNNTSHFSSIFVLFRILLDDLIRLVSVWASLNPEEQLDQLDADAYKHRLDAMRLRVDYTTEFIPDLTFGQSMQAILDEEKNDFYSHSAYSHLFVDQAQKRLKKLPPISEALTRVTAKPNWNLKALSELNVLYKEMSGHVHYSTLVFKEDRDEERRKHEIAHFAVVQIYLYKELLIHLDFFHKRQVPIRAEFPALNQWFNSAVVIRED